MDTRYDRRIFSENLQRLMQKHGYRQSDIAELLGVSRATVSYYCQGKQVPRVDKIEALAAHFGLSYTELMERPTNVVDFPAPPEIEPIWSALNRDGRDELLRYGEELLDDSAYRLGSPAPRMIRHFLVPAAAGYASPVAGEDYEEMELPRGVSALADFCITIRGDSMEPYIRDGEIVYVRREAQMHEFEVGVFFVDGDVYCKQWCTDHTGALYLLSANPKREDANIRIPRSAASTCICFGKVLLDRKLPEPKYI